MLRHISTLSHMKFWLQKQAKVWGLTNIHTYIHTYIHNDHTYVANYYNKKEMKQTIMIRVTDAYIDTCLQRYKDTYIPVSMRIDSWGKWTLFIKRYRMHLASLMQPLSSCREPVSTYIISPRSPLSFSRAHWGEALEALVILGPKGITPISMWEALHVSPLHLISSPNHGCNWWLNAVILIYLVNYI